MIINITYGFPQRIMDFWRRENDLLLENWVFIDTVDLLMQMGVNVLPAAH